MTSRPLEAPHSALGSILTPSPTLQVEEHGATETDQAKERGTERPGIYAIRNIGSGKVYVGSAANISKRWSRHRKDLRMGTHSNPHLQAAWHNYGERAFEFIILELTTDLTEREQFWIDDYGACGPDGYNLCPIARSSRGRPAPPPWDGRSDHALRNFHSPGVQERANATRKAAGALPRQKMTADLVRQMRAEFAADPSWGAMTRLARKYGIAVPTAHNIVHRITWKEVMP